MAMKATLRPTTIREVVENFVDNNEEGVRGFYPLGFLFV